MHSAVLLVLAALTAVALAGGQYYVPRAYYTIDPEGHASPPVPLRRLRRSYNPYPYNPSAGSNANANANAEAYGGGDANANANARAGSGGWGAPALGGYGAARPLLGAGMTARQAGPIVGHSVSATSSVGVDSSGSGYYDQYASVGN